MAVAAAVVAGASAAGASAAGASARFASWLRPPTSPFHDNNLVGAPSRHAICLTGLARSFDATRPSLEQALLAPNSVDLFFYISVFHADSAAEARTIDTAVLTLPRRAVTVELWSAHVVKQMHRDHPRLRLCGEASSKPLTEQCQQEFDAARNQGRSGISLHVFSQWRKRALCWDMLTQHAATHSHTYAAVVSTRLDLNYPPQPLRLDLVAAKANELGAVLVPAGADLPRFNDQLAMGSTASMRPYMQAYQQCGRNAHGNRSVVDLRQDCTDNLALAALAHGHVNIRRFWYQYWIVRDNPNELDYYKRFRETFYIGWYSSACWQRLTFSIPGKVSVKTFVHLNTTCTCNPFSLDDYGMEGQAYVTNANLGELRQFCNFGGDLCSKCEFKSICKLNQGPPPSEGGRVTCISTSARRLRLQMSDRTAYAKAAPPKTRAPAAPKVNAPSAQTKHIRKHLEANRSRPRGNETTLRPSSLLPGCLQHAADWWSRHSIG